MVEPNLIGKILQCHIDSGDPESFVVGRVIYADQTWFIMQDILPAGRWNGYAMYLQDDVVQIEQDTKYIRKLEFLLERRDQKICQPLQLNGPQPIGLLNYAYEKKAPVALELLKSGIHDVVGVILQIEDDWLSVQQLDEYGEDDGKTYVNLEAITRVFYGSEELENLEILMEH